MRLVGLALAAVLIAVAPASAQYAPRPPALIGPMAADDVSEIVQAMGLVPVGHPARSGAFYVQRAVDDYGRVLRVTVDARRSQVIAVEAAGMSRAPYRVYAGYPPRRPYRGYMDDDFDLAPPGSVMGSRAQPPHVLPPPVAAAPRPTTKSAAVAPQRPPIPRKRPASAPEHVSAGSIEPAAPAPQNTPAAPPAPPPKPAGPALTPVAPLE